MTRTSGIAALFFFMLGCTPPQDDIEQIHRTIAASQVVMVAPGMAAQVPLSIEAAGTIEYTIASTDPMADCAFAWLPPSQTDKAMPVASYTKAQRFQYNPKLTDKFSVDSPDVGRWVVRFECRGMNAVSLTFDAHLTNCVKRKDNSSTPVRCPQE